MRLVGLACAAAVLGAVVIAPTSAFAYCRSSVCDGGVEGKVCTPAAADDCGKPLYWVQPCVGFAIQKSASNQVPYDIADQILAISMSAWTGAVCAGGAPDIQVTDLGKVDCSNVEYNQHAGNANILIFRDGKWPYQDAGDGATDTIALTTVTYDTDNGQIYDADIEVNTATYTFSTDDAGSMTDLQSVLTHESGHFLGLAHSTVDDATMFAFYGGGTSLRSLAHDDVAAICDTYPSGRSTEGKCTDLPRHGFAPECATDQLEGECALVADGEPMRLSAVAFSPALATAARLRRRARVKARI